MPDTILGIGLLRADAALAALVQDPEQLDRDRERFSESPPSYRSHLSHNSTLSQPTPRDEELTRVQDWQWKLIGERQASWPRAQFDAQAWQEYDVLEKPFGNRIFQTHMLEIAQGTIRERWIEQGIWDDRWGASEPPHSAWWMHQERLELEPDRVEPPRFSLSATSAQRSPPRPKTDEELRLIEEQRAARARQRDASRPFHQFIHQVSEERRRIEDGISLGDRAAPGLSDSDAPVHRTVSQPQNESNAQGAAVANPPNINTTAYGRVRDTWVKRGIWNKKWGVLPGMSWKHEEYIKDLCREEMGDDFALLPADAFDYLPPPAERKTIEPPARLDQPSASPSPSPPPADIAGAPRWSQVDIKADAQGYEAGGLGKAPGSIQENNTQEKIEML